MFCHLFLLLHLSLKVFFCAMVNLFNFWKYLVESEFFHLEIKIKEYSLIEKNQMALPGIRRKQFLPFGEYPVGSLTIHL